jgi:hypothetical protein
MQIYDMRVEHFSYFHLSMSEASMEWVAKLQTLSVFDNTVNLYVFFSLLSPSERQVIIAS